MKIEIQEVTFKVDELFEAEFNSEEEKQKRIDEEGIESCRCFRFFTRNKPLETILIPQFKIDERGCAILRRQEKEIKAVIPNCKMVWNHISDCIKASMNDSYYKYIPLTSEKLENRYVYICYREDIPDCVGICAYPFPLYKTKE